MGYQAVSHSKKPSPLSPPPDTHWLTLSFFSLLKPVRDLFLEVPGIHRFEKPGPHPGSHWPILLVLECLKQVRSASGVPSTQFFEGSFNPVLTPITQPASSSHSHSPKVLPCTTAQEGRVVNTHTSPEPIHSEGGQGLDFLAFGKFLFFLKSN